MFLLEGPADTFSYMVLGFGVILGIIIVFVVSLFTRARGLARDLALIESMQGEEENPVT